MIRNKMYRFSAPYPKMLQIRIASICIFLEVGGDLGIFAYIHRHSLGMEPKSKPICASYPPDTHSWEVLLYNALIMLGKKHSFRVQSVPLGH